MVQLEAAAENADTAEVVETEAAPDVSTYYPDDVRAEEEAEPEEEAAPEPEGDEELEDDGEESDEPEEAIAAPVSLKAEEKERFAQLPAEAQRMMTEVLTRRDTEVQKGLESAREAQRVAERTAADQVAQTQRDFAERFERFTQAFAPQPPQREHYRDNVDYLVAMEQHRGEMGQFQQLAAQIDGMKGEADGHSQARQQEWIAEQKKQLMSVPEFADEATRAEFISGIEAFAVNDLGYTQEEILQAGAKDILVLKKFKAAVAKAEKWDAHMARRNERPRQSGKFVAKPAPAGGRVAAAPATNPLKSLYPDD